jgi:hypothetical protein
MVTSLNASPRHTTQELEATSKELAQKKDLPFNYSKEQWQDILEAVEAGCAFPSHFDPEDVLYGVNKYLKEIPSYRSPSRRAEAWRHAAASLRRARDLLRKADAPGWGTVDDGPMCYGLLKLPSGLTVPDILDRWQKDADRIAGVCRNSGRHDEPRPSLVLLEALLDYWSNAGGMLTRSRTSPEARTPGQISGPTVRFMQALLQPIMKKRTPKPEGLRRIIERAAIRLKELEQDEEFAAYSAGYRSAALAGANKEDADKAGLAAQHAKMKKPNSSNTSAHTRGRGR